MYALTEQWDTLPKYVMLNCDDYVIKIPYDLAQEENQIEWSNDYL